MQNQSKYLITFKINLKTALSGFKYALKSSQTRYNETFKSCSVRISLAADEV